LNSQQHNTNAGWFLLLGVILVGANLRAPLSSVGALIPFIRDDLGISNTLAGSITTLPLLAFALLSPFAPTIARRIGMERTIAAAIAVLIGGLALRSAGGTTALFAGTVFIGLAIAIGNVLMPAIVKLKFPLRIGFATGMYAVGMNVFGALGSGLSVPMAEAGLEWRGALAIWGLLGIVTLAVWWSQLKHHQPYTPPAVASGTAQRSVWRSPLAWNVTFFMGSQSLIYYSLITWVPDILLNQGYSESGAGWLLFLMQVALIPVTFVVPMVAEKMKNQIPLAIYTGAAFIIGLCGFNTANTFFYPLWAILLGTAGGCAFSLSMMFFTLRTHSSKEAADLSGMAQSFGYLFAALGPVLVGALYDITHSWTAPIGMLLVVCLILLGNGLAASRDRKL